MFIEVLKGKYDLLFGKPWSPWIGGLLLGLTNVFLFTYAKPWTTFDGVINWGDNLLGLLGTSQQDIVNPILYSTSVINLSLVLGAFVAALLSKEFGLRMSPPLEFLKAFVGGCLMGVGANLSLGCNIGGFFSSFSALSLAGLAMMVGLMLGAYGGIQYLIWETEKIPLKYQVASQQSGTKQKKLLSPKFQPVFGGVVLLFSVAAAFLYDRANFTQLGGFLVFGLFLGIVNQRSRFCFVKTFREPFLTGEGQMTRAAILALAISVIGFGILKWTELREPDWFVRPSFWAGSFVGGIIFGFGMSLTGGCASGSMWRAGEGHLKLWVALLAFAVSGSLGRHFLVRSGLVNKLGEAFFLPDLVSWKWALILVLGFLALWSLVVTWNEATKKFTLM